MGKGCDTGQTFPVKAREKGSGALPARTCKVPTQRARPKAVCPQEGRLTRERGIMSWLTKR